VATFFPMNNSQKFSSLSPCNQWNISQQQICNFTVRSNSVSCSKTKYVRYSYHNKGGNWWSGNIYAVFCAHYQHYFAPTWSDMTKKDSCFIIHHDNRSMLHWNSTTRSFDETGRFIASQRQRTPYWKPQSCARARKIRLTRFEPYLIFYMIWHIS
jgi:hypothetical protein